MATTMGMTRDKFAFFMAARDSRTECDAQHIRDKEAQGRDKWASRPSPPLFCGRGETVCKMARAPSNAN